LVSLCLTRAAGKRLGRSSNAARIPAVTADRYVDQILSKYHVDAGTNSAAYRTAAELKGTAEQWAAKCLRSVSMSGSFAKQTAVSSRLAGGSDIDLFITSRTGVSGAVPSTAVDWQERGRNSDRASQGKVACLANRCPRTAEYFARVADSCRSTRFSVSRSRRENSASRPFAAASVKVAIHTFLK
jgi:hypothetical protein